jgi:hypothetical protein
MTVISHELSVCRELGGDLCRGKQEDIEGEEVKIF